MKKLLFLFCLGIAWVRPLVAGVTVTAPANNSNVSTTVQYVATASSPACSKGISAIGIYTAPNTLAYVVKGSSLNTNLNLSPGTYNTTVQEWDNCGWSSGVPITITVGGNSGVTVTTPSNNSQVSSPANYVASATTSCSKGIAAMGVYTSPNQLAYASNGATLNANISLNPGTYHTTVQAWDNCGGASTQPVTVTVGANAGVQVSAPANNSTVSSPVQFVATGATKCAQGISAMGIYTASGVLAYSANGSSLDTSLTLSPGTYNTTVQEWDKCGGTAKTPVTITVNGGGNGNGGGTFWNLQAQTSGWTGYGLLPPGYEICQSCNPGGPNVSWSWTPGISNPSQDGQAVKTTIGGNEAYSDVLWNNHLIGDFSSQGLPDSNRTLAPTLHNFTYDVWFYLSDNTTPQALEFDINQFVNGQSYIWGHECRVAGGNEWDTWSNPGQYWVKSGIGCWPVVGWNHLVLQVQRTSDGHLLFKSISLNGTTNPLNRYDTPTATNWYGITVNYQIDGNKWQAPYAVYLDQLNFTWTP